MEKKAKVLLAIPNMNGVKGGLNRILPYHGIGCLGGVLQQRGHELHVRDTSLEGHERHVPNPDGRTVTIGESDEDIQEHIEVLKPDYVGISILFSNSARHGKNLARLVKEVDPGITTVMGGNHVNHTYQDIIRENPAIDFIFRGEADFTFEEFISAHLNGGDVSKIPGIVYMNPDGSVFNGPGTARVGLAADGKKNSNFALDVLPPEARGAMNIKKYMEIGHFHSPRTPRKVGSVMATRGCPEICTFCTTPEMFGRTVRWRSPQSMFEEMKMLKDEYGVEEAQFEDDTLTAHRKNLSDLCRLMIKGDLGLSWCPPNGIKVNYPPNQERQLEMFKEMHASGCYQVTLAVESGNQGILDNLVKKNLPLDTVKPAIENAKNAGLFVHVYLMVGFPGETYEQMENTVRFGEEIEADSYSISILCPLPGTPVYDIARGKVPHGRYINREEVEEMLKITGGKNYMREGITDDDILLTRSLMEVDGFSSAEEFESWVDVQNKHLNSLLLKRDPDRFYANQGITDPRHLMKQT